MYKYNEEVQNNQKLLEDYKSKHEKVEYDYLLKSYELDLARYIDLKTYIKVSKEYYNDIRNNSKSLEGYTKEFGKDYLQYLLNDYRKKKALEVLDLETCMNSWQKNKDFHIQKSQFGVWGHDIAEDEALESQFKKQRVVNANKEWDKQDLSDPKATKVRFGPDEQVQTDIQEIPWNQKIKRIIHGIVIKVRDAEGNIKEDKLIICQKSEKETKLTSTKDIKVERKLGFIKKILAYIGLINRFETVQEKFETTHMVPENKPITGTLDKNGRFTIMSRYDVQEFLEENKGLELVDINDNKIGTVDIEGKTLELTDKNSNNISTTIEEAAKHSGLNHLYDEKILIGPDNVKGKGEWISAIEKDGVFRDQSGHILKASMTEENEGLYVRGEEDHAKTTAELKENGHMPTRATPLKGILKKEVAEISETIDKVQDNTRVTNKPAPIKQKQRLPRGHR
jgi:hypothetical protein